MPGICRKCTGGGTEMGEGRDHPRNPPIGPLFPSLDVKLHTWPVHTSRYCSGAKSQYFQQRHVRQVWLPAGGIYPPLALLSPNTCAPGSQGHRRLRGEVLVEPLRSALKIQEQESAGELSLSPGKNIHLLTLTVLSAGHTREQPPLTHGTPS